MPRSIFPDTEATFPERSIANAPVPVISSNVSAVPSPNAKREAEPVTEPLIFSLSNPFGVGSSAPDKPTSLRSAGKSMSMSPRNARPFASVSFVFAEFSPMVAESSILVSALVIRDLGLVSFRSSSVGCPSSTRSPVMVKGASRFASPSLRLAFSAR